MHVQIYTFYIYNTKKTDETCINTVFFLVILMILPIELAKKLASTIVFSQLFLTFAAKNKAQ